jgi:hypothetical protein
VVKAAQPPKRDAVTQPAVLRALLAEAGTSAILIGGQALSVWVFEYGLALPPDVAAITCQIRRITVSWNPVSCGLSGSV